MPALRSPVRGCYWSRTGVRWPLFQPAVCMDGERQRIDRDREALCGAHAGRAVDSDTFSCHRIDRAGVGHRGRQLNVALVLLILRSGGAGRARGAGCRSVSVSGCRSRLASDGEGHGLADVDRLVGESARGLARCLAARKLPLTLSINGGATARYCCARKRPSPRRSLTGHANIRRWANQEPTGGHQTN